MKFNLLERIKNVSPYLIFFPFLIFYVVLVLLFQKNTLLGDEARYLDFARNLTHGFYSAPPPDTYMPNGPGYPLILAPFVALKAPIVLMALANAFFYYFSVVFLFKALKQIVSFQYALAFSLFWALYYNSYQDIVLVVTEPITSLIISLVLYFWIKAFAADNPAKNKKYIILAGIAMGYLVLTKIAFGYVLLFAFIINVILWLLNRSATTHKKNLVILLVAFATIMPYLIYTFQLTGKLFYLGGSGADSLYWMSTPYEGEYGDWQPYPEKPQPNQYRVYYSEDSIASNHLKEITEIYKFSGTEREKAYTEKAIDNIKSHPGKFIQNCISNVGRMLFSYPNAYTLQNNKTLLRLPLNGLITVLSVFCLVPTFLNWRKISYPIRFLLLFALVYLGLSTVVSVLTRMFTVIVPVLLIWISFIIQRTFKFKLQFDKDTTFTK